MTPPPDPAGWLVVSRPELARVPPEPLRQYIADEQVRHEMLAERLGVELTTLRQLLYQRDRVSTEQAKRVCDALGIAPSTLWADWAELLELRVLESEPWRKAAVCIDHTHLFFAPQHEGPAQAEARETFALEYCARCPVRIECRDAARRNREFGVWGGETEADRIIAGYPPGSVPHRK